MAALRRVEVMPEKARPVLVVEDDPALGRVIELVLRDAGYMVVSANDGQEALDKIDQQRPGVVLLDMKMPVMDGWEFASELRARHGRAVPVIMVTAAWDSQQRAQEIGADDYLDKPFDINDLVRVVEQHYVGQ